jgi:hypothetical protein
MATTKKTAVKRTTRKTAKSSASLKAAAKKTKEKQSIAKKPATKKSNRQMSALDAAAKVLGETTEPLNTKAMIAQMEAKGYWISPGGQTPHATLYSAILREIQKRDQDARFKKVERGKFALA